MRDAQHAIEILKIKLDELSALSESNALDGDFSRWHMTTSEVLKQYVSNTQYRLQFVNIRFKPSEFWDTNPFPQGCIKAKACLEGAIEHIERFGLEKPKPPLEAPESGGGLHFHGKITNLALAMNSATQNVSQTAGSEGEALRQIGEILRESGELRQREVVQALDVITKLATELHKSRDGWNWRNILDWSGKLLDIANNATDALTKLTPYLPILVGLCEEARKMIG